MIGTPVAMWDRIRFEPVDAADDVGEQVTGDGDLGHVERDVTAMADDLATNLDQFHPLGSASYPPSNQPNILIFIQQSRSVGAK
jgi:hypothetical protein